MFGKGTKICKKLVSKQLSEKKKTVIQRVVLKKIVIRSTQELEQLPKIECECLRFIPKVNIRDMNRL